MARKPTDYVQVKIRMREALRRNLEKLAQLRDHSTNAEALWRIERTIAQDEAIEELAKEMEAREAELQEQWRQHVEEQARKDAEHEAAIRDSRVLQALLGGDESAQLLRKVILTLGENPHWPDTLEGRRAFADKVHRFIVSADIQEVDDDGQPPRAVSDGQGVLITAKIGDDGDIQMPSDEEVDEAFRAAEKRGAKRNDGLRFKSPKSGKGRTVALSETVVAELRTHRAKRAQEMLRLGAGLSDDDLVVAHEDGSQVTPIYISQQWSRLIAKTHLARLRFHDLRHAHATHMLANGVHPKIASERLGHSKVSITLDLYSHVIPGMQADAAATVDAALKEAPKRKGSKSVAELPRRTERE